MAILVVGSILEYTAVNDTFQKFNEELVVLQQKVEEEIAVKDDALKVQNFWIEKKKTLHVIIPHNDIKEIDLWISECCSLIDSKMFDDALSKIEVAIELVEQIPKTFGLRLENIM